MKSWEVGIAQKQKPKYLKYILGNNIKILGMIEHFCINHEKNIIHI